MSLFTRTPQYYGEGAATCQRKDRGVLDWFARLLGFPPTPCYQDADPADPEPPCSSTTTQIDD